MTYVIKLKRTTKGFENPDEAAELATSNLAYGEAAFLNKYGYIVVGRSGGTTTVGNASRVFKAIPKSMADNGMFYSEYDSDKKFVNTQIVLYNNDNYSASSYTVYPRTKFDAVTDSNNVTLTNRMDAKMNKENPTGTGTLSINRNSSGSYLTGTNSVAVGYQNVATSNSAFAEGYQTKAQGLYSHSEGYQTTAGAQSSHAEGNTTNASGQNSHAEGNATTASGLNSHAEGLGTIAQGQNQSVSGKYNVADTSNTFATIIGNGTSSSKSNAAAIDWNGNLYLKGNVYVGGSSANATGGSNVVTFSNVDDIYEWQRFKTSFSQSSSSTSELYVCGYGYAGQTLSTTVYYGTTYTRDDQYGTYSIKNPTTTTVSSPSAGVTLFDSMPVNSWFTIHPHSRDLYKKTSNTTYTKNSNTCMFNNLTHYWISNFKVNNFEVLRSNSSSTYPTSGLNSGYYYIYIGKSGDRHVFTIENQECSTKYPGNVIKLPVLNSQYVDVSEIIAIGGSTNMIPQWLISSVSLNVSGLGESGQTFLAPSGKSTFIWGDKSSAIEVTNFDISGRSTSVNIIPYIGLQKSGNIHVIY